MDGTCAQEAILAAQHRIKLKQQIGRVDALSVDGKNTENNTGINNLPDEILIAILSRMSLKEFGRTSVISNRWRYLWRFTSGSLDFDAMDNVTRTAMESKNFRSWVNRVLELHQGPQLDNFVVRCNILETRSDEEIDRWVYFATRNEVKEFELSLTVNFPKPFGYEFPDMEKLLARKSAFGRLRSFKLEGVDVMDEFVHYILASCPYLEVLCIDGSLSMRNLQVVDPIPNLKLLSIQRCYKIQSLEISAKSLISFIYESRDEEEEEILLYKYIPNLSDLTLMGGCAMSFIHEANKHSSYSAQLVKLKLIFLQTEVQRAFPLDLPQLYSLKRLELYTDALAGQSLFFFTLFIKASPLLSEFRIKICYILDAEECELFGDMPFPEVSAAEATMFYHKNLKLVEMAGYIGCSSEGKFLVQLLKVAPSIEKVVIDTEGEHFVKEPVHYHEEIIKQTGARTRVEAKERAKNFISSFPPQTQVVII